MGVGAFMLEPRSYIYMLTKLTQALTMIRDQCQTLPIEDGVPGNLGIPSPKLQPEVPGIAFVDSGKLKGPMRRKLGIYSDS